ncbi:primosomal protein N' [Euhalothece natronophila Z-M001]|uniref:Replication restart protein PriA n=1 Tax=Euhalothece natronophila Z-M001 TaxID=522448 RepID=A0A5B8NJR3_9CHRO|nr:primosomal protein N' [Euhalothece natronophila]QDZ38751.1 primosomal protein N' [Euhalothece natronophila Z-M001]
MLNSPVVPVVASSQGNYNPDNSQTAQWVEVLVDCPDIPGLLTYHLPSEMTVQPGDILSVPLRNQIVGGIAIRLVSSLPENLSENQIRDVETVVSESLFPPRYWQLLEKVAHYYCSPLLSVIHTALPPGLLGKSQLRIRLKPDVIPEGATEFCSSVGVAVLRLLQSQQTGDYSARYLRQQIKGAQRGINELMRRGWVESYLQQPQQSRPKRQKAVLLVGESPELTPRQREVLEFLRRRGGELWLTELLQACSTTSSTVSGLEKKGCVVIQEQERLRFAQTPDQELDQPKTLNHAQQEALNTINALDGFQQVLLHGVTGSGKTEVYLQAIAPILQAGYSVLILVPEIGLTPQLCDRFRARYGNQVCIYHSALSTGERYDTWRQMLRGDPQIVIGTRSAVFAPLPKLGMIILDEEHDSSFKQTQRLPTYHARTVAKWRAELEHCPLILGSATPSLETWETPEKYYLSLPERIYSRPLPPISVVDMRQELQQGNRSIFSQPLQTALQNLKAQGKQGILFIPRRGHSTFVSCRSCGYVMECPHCDVSLSYHYTHEGGTQSLRCHYCNHTQLQPKQCPACGSPYLKHFGTGTQRVKQALEQEFPDLRTLRFDSDTTRTKGAHRSLLNQFTNYEADLLVGTQMLTKGLDIAQVTLVAVVSADGVLHRSDYMAAERAFQTLAQVAGRAGRGDDPGQVIIQTYNPEHPVIAALYNHDYRRFAQAELENRYAYNYPPYGKLILLNLSGLDALEVQQTATLLADVCRSKNEENQYEVLGPAPASVMRIARRYRWQILLKCSRTEGENQLSWLTDLYQFCPKNISLNIDVDPLDMG